MNEKQWELLGIYHDLIYDTTEKMDDMNERVCDPKIEEAIELILNGLDIIAVMLCDHEEAEKLKPPTK